MDRQLRQGRTQLHFQGQVVRVGYERELRHPKTVKEAAGRDLVGGPEAKHGRQVERSYLCEERIQYAAVQHQR